MVGCCGANRCLLFGDLLILEAGHLLSLTHSPSWRYKNKKTPLQSRITVLSKAPLLLNGPRIRKNSLTNVYAVTIPGTLRL